MKRTVLQATLAACVVLAATACGSDEGSGATARGGQVEQSPTSTPEASAEAFHEFSGVHLPDGAENPEITVELDDRGSPVYWVSFGGPRAAADQLCEQVGNYLIQARGVSDEQAETLRIPESDLAAANEPVWGCSAVIQSTGADIEAVVLPMDDDTARVYLRAEAFRT